jgi:hypothetical protein
MGRGESSETIMNPRGTSLNIDTAQAVELVVSLEELIARYQESSYNHGNIVGTYKELVQTLKGEAPYLFDVYQLKELGYPSRGNLSIQVALADALIENRKRAPKIMAELTQEEIDEIEGALGFTENEGQQGHFLSEAYRALDHAQDQASNTSAS